jgi:D-tyrosyl-tRNA(Tyr) deacylase
LRIVIQRVSSSRVSVSGRTVGEIGAGLCLLIGVAPGDDERAAQWAASKLVNLRIFEDSDGKMNRSILDTGGEILAISQFTLYADCAKGRRPSFTGAAEPSLANALYEFLTARLREMGVSVQTGVFGAEMMVDITNDGPVTIILDTADMPEK